MVNIGIYSFSNGWCCGLLATAERASPAAFRGCCVVPVKTQMTSRSTAAHSSGLLAVAPSCCLAALYTLESICIPFYGSTQCPWEAWGGGRLFIYSLQVREPGWKILSGVYKTTS